MSDPHRNLIEGDWVEGEAIATLNPSDTNEIVGHCAREQGRYPAEFYTTVKTAYTLA